jgi:hypothetical protein
VREIANALDDLRGAAEQRVVLGREGGASFWRRFALNRGVLDRVARRDDRFADELERLEAEAAERHAAYERERAERCEPAEVA